MAAAALLNAKVSAPNTTAFQISNATCVLLLISVVRVVNGYIN